MSADDLEPGDGLQCPGADPFLYLPGCNTSFRRTALLDVRGSNPLLTYTYDDAEICARLIDRDRRFATLSDVLVGHQRAPNCGRGAKQVVLDPYPYPTMFCRTVFALHCCEPVQHREAVMAELRLAANAEERSTQAVLDAVRQAGNARPTVGFAPVAADTLHRYR